ncbi:hypothetical protein EYE40_08280 [Glaciihabitans arcticus]|uniref:Uncharacterized protein n=1 Tax=Glaciihabitans arcticus TaxID=2668039 RepID=A0A4Q9GTA4_9MICO|nr:hypothetical protein [Glaciihabitans arcticus]TBN57394.1 hypothetical protein EYE40_08280 [Glaciihabitans arcticus]
MSAVARLAVRVAVRMLPSSMRDRYREQWAADLRDAAEAGIRPSEIAMGSLAFAVSVDRPVIETRAVSTGATQRRSRLAAGLALSAALLGLSQYASIVTFGGLVGHGVIDFAMFIGSGLLTVYTVLAVLASITLSFTRGVPGAVRLAVWLLALASAAPLAYATIGSGLEDVDNPYLTPATAAYLVAAVLIAAAAVLLVRAFAVREASTGHPRSVALLGGVLVAAAVAAGVLGAVRHWSTRAPYVEMEGISAEARAELSAAIIRYDGAVDVVFVVWAIVGAVLATMVVAFGFKGGATTGGVVVITAAALCAALLANGAILTFLQLLVRDVDASLVVAALLLVARYGIIALCLIGVGGMRLAPRKPVAELVAA